MAESSIPVDLLNPGQVFACVGLAEAAEILFGGAAAAFDWSEPAAPRFRLRADGVDDPVRGVVEFLGRAKAQAVAPAGLAERLKWTDSWGPRPESLPLDQGYPIPAPESPATYACALDDGTYRILLDHWGDGSGRDNVKFWAGSGGYPGAALARDALALVAGKAADAAVDPFDLAAPQTSTFRFDWRHDYIPLDTGFSLNAHAAIEAIGYPLVEVLAAIGLGHARALRPNPRDKLEYLYEVVGIGGTGATDLLPLPFLRAALGCCRLPFPRRRFRMHLKWPGQENQARAITSVSEEIPS